MERWFSMVESSGPVSETDWDAIVNAPVHQHQEVEFRRDPPGHRRYAVWYRCVGCGSQWKKMFTDKEKLIWVKEWPSETARLADERRNQAIREFHSMNRRDET